jgi:hypothetical protein
MEDKSNIPRILQAIKNNSMSMFSNFSAQARELKDGLMTVTFDHVNKCVIFQHGRTIVRLCLRTLTLKGIVMINDFRVEDVSKLLNAFTITPDHIAFNKPLLMSDRLIDGITPTECDEILQLMTYQYYEKVKYDVLKNHLHSIDDVIGLRNELDLRALGNHIHAIHNITYLQEVLDSKSEIGHEHRIEVIANLRNELDMRALGNHMHSIHDITNLK